MLPPGQLAPAKTFRTDLKIETDRFEMEFLEKPEHARPQVEPIAAPWRKLT